MFVGAGANNRFNKFAPFALVMNYVSSSPDSDGGSAVAQGERVLIFAFLLRLLRGSLNSAFTWLICAKRRRQRQKVH